MINKTLKTFAMSALLASTAIAATAQEYTIRATANSNENDEDYDGRLTSTSRPLAVLRGSSPMCRFWTCPI